MRASAFAHALICRELRSAPDHVTRIERDLDILPQFIGFGPEHVEGLAAEDGADGAVARRHEQRTLPGGYDLRSAVDRSVGLQADSYRYDDLFGVSCARRWIPQLRKARPQRVELVLRELRRGGARCADRCRVAERSALGFLALRRLACRAAPASRADRTSAGFAAATRRPLRRRRDFRGPPPSSARSSWRRRPS